MRARPRPGLSARPIAPTIVGCLHTPMCWSPDGRWLAYTVAVRPRAEILTPGWTFERATVEAAKAAVQLPSRWEANAVWRS